MKTLHAIKTEPTFCNWIAMKFRAFTDVYMEGQTCMVAQGPTTIRRPLIDQAHYERQYREWVNRGCPMRPNGRPEEIR